MKLLTEAPVLAYYNAKQETILSVMPVPTDSEESSFSGTARSCCQWPITQDHSQRLKEGGAQIAIVYGSEKIHIFLRCLDYDVEAAKQKNF